MSGSKPLTLVESHPAGNLFDRRPAGHRYLSRRTLAALLLVILPTLALLAWLGYRLFARPDWVPTLPTLLHELLVLVEFAAAATLALVWAGIFWRAAKGDRPGGDPRVGPVDLDGLYTLSPQAFERYTAGLFRQKGYQVTLRGRSGDHGVDLELTGRNGKRAVVQCKRYQNTIGEDIVRELYGTLIHERAAHAFLVTTADISTSARNWAQGKPLTLIDGETLIKIAATLREKNAQG